MEVENLKHVVIGAGASGLAAAALLRSRGAEVVINDSRSRDALKGRAEQAEAMGATLALGSHDRSVFDRAVRVVLSPGVPPLDVVADLEKEGVEVIGEVELASRFLSAMIVGITGTNGKSTVTTLVADMLRRSGLETFVGGNLGVALSEAVGSHADVEAGRVVVELSSFQLEAVSSFRPHVAAYLNLTPDHLDRYDSLAHYGATKARIFAAQQADDHAVVPAADPSLGAELPDGVRRHTFGAPDGEVRAQRDSLVDSAGGLSFPLDALSLPGRHNVDNAAAAVLIARLSGATNEAIDRALRETASLPHRAELVRELDGVAYVDDSKATNVGAAIAALSGLASPERRAVLILGGVDKGGSYEPLVELLIESGRGLVLIGEAAELIERAVRGRVPCVRAEAMPDAVTHAQKLAQVGDVVLLAPACSSYDMYRSYAHRGDAFQAAVRALGGAS